MKKQVCIVCKKEDDEEMVRLQVSRADENDEPLYVFVHSQCRKEYQEHCQKSSTLVLKDVYRALGWDWPTKEEE